MILSLLTYAIALPEKHDMLPLHPVYNLEDLDMLEMRARCTGGNECCDKQMCGEGEGDCDADSQCTGNLKCGDSNCSWGSKEGLGRWGSADDCCYDPSSK